ncbi:MAG: hypothetical protein U0841_25155 [Chloroflexia bacterium]
MIGRTRSLDATDQSPGRTRLRPAALLDRLLGAANDLLAAPLEERPRAVVLPSPRAGWREFVGLDRRLVVPLTMLIGVFIFCFIRQTDPDWWWHLRIGQDIWAAKAIPTVDTYSFTRPGQPFIAHEWLFELLTYLGLRAFDYRGLVVIMALVVTATYWLHYLLLRAVGAGRVLSGLLVCWTLLLSFMAITLRPHIFTLLFLSLELWCLYLYRAGRQRFVWILPPLTLLWVNLHGAWIMGIGTLALFIVGEWLNGRIHGEPLKLRNATLALIGMLVAAVANPEGPALLLYPLTFVGGESATMRYIQEWQPPNFRETMGLAFGLSVLLLAVLGLRRPRIDYTFLLWTVAFGYLGFSAQRHVPLFALVVMPILAQQLPTAWRGPERPYRENILSAAANWVLLLVVAGTMATIVFGNPLAQVHREPNLTNYPTQALAYLKDHPQGNVLNEDGWGGYLITNLPERPVFIDSRVDFYGRDFLEEYITVVRVRTGWRDVLDRYDIAYILMPPDTQLVAALQNDPNWRTVVSVNDEHDKSILLERVTTR